MKTKPINIVVFYTKAQLKELTGLSESELQKTFDFDDWDFGFMIEEEINDKNKAMHWILGSMIFSLSEFRHPIKHNNKLYYMAYHA